MLNNRTRLRVEMLEGREVPAVAIGTEDIVDPPLMDDEKIEIVEVDIGEDLIALEDVEVIQNVISMTSSLDGDPAVEDVDLATFVTANKAAPSQGDNMKFTFTVVNNGTSPATNVTLDTTLPEGVSFVSVEQDQGTYDEATGEWSVGTIYPGAPLKLTIKVKVLEVTEQTATASISHSDMPDPVADNNSASKTVTPALGALRMSYTASASTLTVGATVAYTIFVRNAGPGTARDVVIQNTLGDGIRFIRADAPTRGSFNAGNHTWTINALKSGATATIRVIGVVKSVGKHASSIDLLSATGIDETRSKHEASTVVTGTTVNNPSTWSYVSLGSAPQIAPTPNPLAAVVPPSTYQLWELLRAFFRM